MKTKKFSFLLLILGIFISCVAIIVYISLPKGDSTQSSQENEKSALIIDSNYTFGEATKGKNIPEDIKAALRLITVKYISFDRKIHQGQILVHKDIATDTQEIFQHILEEQFPIEKIIPIIAYNWDDEASMQDNNTSAFNYRYIKGTTKLSNHAYGRAIDINPLLNPYVKNDGTVEPAGAVYDPNYQGTLTEDSLVVKIFEDRGFIWGGRWGNGKDWQHFEKP